MVCSVGKVCQMPRACRLVEELERWVKGRVRR